MSFIGTFIGIDKHADQNIQELTGARRDAVALSMYDLATLFKTSKAKIILFILDCCFSGAAPARVLEDTPLLRDEGDFLSAIAGKGRIIIAASGKNEPALENPLYGHGLLTKAIIDVFKTEENSISIPVAMDIMLDVRKQQYYMIGLMESQLTILKGDIQQHYMQEQ